MTPEQEVLWRDDQMQGTALFSEDRRHRFLLSRTWTEPPIWMGAKPVLFVMLNPSLADAGKLDPTVRKCVGFAKRWGFGALLVGNIYSLVSPYPEDLLKDSEPVHPDTDAALLRMARVAARIVVAWGTQRFLADRAYDVVKLLAREQDLFCLGQTKDGWPRHPLYRSYEAPLEIYRSKI